MNTTDAIARRKAALDTPTDLTPQATKDIAGALTILLADMFALYVKTKNFHWHVCRKSGGVMGIEARDGVKPGDTP
jgi:starvation-inducible DNA-binding protein